jgi:hypothetical protein
MARRFPDTRIIYILRHPVERIWSQAKMDLGRRGKLENASKRSVRRYLEREDVVANSDYAANLERWTSHFGAERVHVEFLEAITADPHASLARLCRFLELEYSTSLFSRSIESARNTTPRTPIPPDVHVWLARRQLEPACALHAYLDCENSFAYLRDIERVALGMGT